MVTETPGRPALQALRSSLRQLILRVTQVFSFCVECHRFIMDNYAFVKWLWVKATIFGVGAPPILVYFSGDWDVHWGYDLGFDPCPNSDFRFGARKVMCFITSKHVALLFGRVRLGRPLRGTSNRTCTQCASDCAKCFSAAECATWTALRGWTHDTVVFCLFL